MGTSTVYSELLMLLSLLSMQQPVVEGGTEKSMGSSGQI